MKRAFRISTIVALLLASCGDVEPVVTDENFIETSSTDCADVIAVEVARDGETPEGVPTYRFAVTVASVETGWDKYADRWEVLDTDGTVLGERILAHPHVDEQPFTRSQSGIPVPGSQVEVRAHDSVEGFCGRQQGVVIP